MPLRADIALRFAAASGVALLLTGGVCARAALTFVDPVWTRPATLTDAAATRSTFQHWDNFASSAGPNVPDKVDVNPNGHANAYDASAATDDSIVTSTGNIYAGHALLTMRVVIPNYAIATADSTQFHFQLRTRGTEVFDDDGADPHTLNFTRLFVDGTLISSLPSFSYHELYRLSTGSPNSYIVEQSIDFSLAGNAASNTIEWSLPRSSSSQDEIAVDSAVVIPEPTIFASLLLITPLARRRRRTAEAIA